jgi:hypothetical protein
VLRDGERISRRKAWAPCVRDTQPRTFSRGGKAELQAMADRVVTAMATQKLATLTRAATSLPL